MKNAFRFPQLLLRIAAGVGFITPVLDRVGFLGAFGGRNIEWGNWDNFINYTGTLMPFLDKPIVNIMGILATIAETLIGISLLIGFKTRLAATGSFLLTLTFASMMALFLGLKLPINFATFTVCAASLLLATIPVYEWSVDEWVAKSHPFNQHP